MELKDVITSAAASIGAALGIYNFWRAHAADRVRLAVTPRASAYKGYDGVTEYYLHSRNHYDLRHPSSPPDTLSIEVVNLSKFSVTVDEVGLKSRFGQRRIALPQPILRDGKPWPRKLEPREAVVAFFDMHSLLGEERLRSVTRAYASSSCGATCYGGSGALKELVQLVRARR